MSRNLCVIPARGGSKRIPRKNIKDFLGKPIIAYSIEAAIKSGLFKEVMVSTDDEEISKVAEAYGARVPFMRSKENSDDFATLADVIKEVEGEYMKRGFTFDYICYILPTAPLIKVSDIHKGFAEVQREGVGSVRPVVRFSYPIQRAVKISESGMEMFNPEYRYTRSQDLEASFHDAGLFYWIKAEQKKAGNKPMAFEIPEIRAQDIDTELDWKLAEIKFEFLKGSESEGKVD